VYVHPVQNTYTIYLYHLLRLPAATQGIVQSLHEPQHHSLNPEATIEVIDPLVHA
jgi:hypothetical protein